MHFQIYQETRMAKIHNCVEFYLGTSLLQKISRAFKKITYIKMYKVTGIIGGKKKSNEQKYWNIFFRGSIEIHKNLPVSWATFKRA